MGETIKLIDVIKGILVFQKIGNKCPKSLQRHHSTYNLSLPEITLLNGQTGIFPMQVLTPNWQYEREVTWV